MTVQNVLNVLVLEKAPVEQEVVVVQGGLCTIRGCVWRRRAAL